MVISFAAPATNAETFEADLKVCVRDESGAPIKRANVQLKGGRNDVKLTPDNEGCYTNKGISFDTTKQYSLVVAADGHETKTQNLDISQFKPRAEALPSPIILQRLPQSDASPSAPSPPPSPSVSPIANEFGFDWWRILTATSLVGLLLIASGGLVLLWRVSSWVPAIADRLLTRHPVSVTLSEGVTTFNKAFEKMEMTVTRLVEQQTKQNEILVEMGQILATAPNENLQQRKSSTGDTAEAPKANAYQLSDRERSVIAYERFLRGEHVLPEPISLSDVGGGSMTDSLGPRSVLLEENIQGAMLLFRTGGLVTTGWVYPDTKYNYREAELRSVFPEITSEQFHYLKTKRSLDGCQLKPILVKQIEETGKWQVEIENSEK